MKPIVAYLRVSKGKQARSGLGVEAQREAVTRFTEAEGFAVVDERVEVETGKGADALDRGPQLVAALDLARKRKCSIVVAKLDRLSRDVAFISGLMASYSWLSAHCTARALRGRRARSCRRSVRAAHLRRPG
jgi:DNA invertase Pin-like site-specific DNA recombinase